MIRLDLAMNNDNGNATGYVSCIEAREYNPDRLGETLYRLEPEFTDEINGVCVCQIYNGAMQLKLSRKAFPIKSYAYGVGSWIWNSVVITDEIHALMFQYLKTMTFKVKKTGKVFKKWQMIDCLDDWQVKWDADLTPDNDICKGCKEFTLTCLDKPCGKVKAITNKPFWTMFNTR